MERKIARFNERLTIQKNEVTAEPEDGQEARLSADELDAVLFAIGFIKSITDRGGRDND